jgi:type IX secretion system PorP/SprF family membrane protein
MTKIKFQLKSNLLLITCLLVLLQKSHAQQKVQYTQYMFNGLALNPAYAGADEALSLTFVQRRQWAQIESAPTTQALTAHTLFKKKHVGLGLSIVNDRIGVHRNLDFVTHYAYHLKTGTASTLSVGLQAGVYNRKSDYASLVGHQSTDPKLYNPFITSTSIDFGAGIYFRSPKLHAGLSVPELVPERISVNDTISIRASRSNYFLYARYNLFINENVTLQPGVLLKYLHNVPLSFDVNVNLIYRRVLTTGFSYRKSESIDFLLKAQVTPQLQVGYSYDHPVGLLSNLSNGSHELMINYLFRFVQKDVASPR